MMRPIALITTVLVLAFAAPAGAQTGPFGPLPNAATPTPAQTVQAPDTGETGSTTLYIILGALVIGFGVMGYIIMRDARRKAPTVLASGPAVAEGTGARKPHTQAAKKKMRQKTRAQKQARKAHRR